MLNSITLVGRVGANPEVKYYDSGKIKATVTLAVDRKQRNADPDWFNLEFWGKSAEVVSSYVRKGKEIAVHGSLKIETWSDRTTNADRSKPVIVVDNLQLLGKKETSASVSEPMPTETSFSEEDIPI